MTEKTRVDFRIDKDLLEKFDTKCKSEHRDRTKTIIMLIEEYIKKKSTKN